MTHAFNLPDTRGGPDNPYFDGQVVSYNFTADGYEARLGIIQPGFEGTFPADEGGENITLIDPKEGSQLTIEVIGKDGNVETSHSLVEEGDALSVPGGRQMKVSTAGAVVRYVCVYPGRPVKK